MIFDWFFSLFSIRINSLRWTWHHTLTFSGYRRQTHLVGIICHPLLEFCQIMAGTNICVPLCSSMPENMVNWINWMELYRSIARNTEGNHSNIFFDKGDSNYLGFTESTSLCRIFCQHLNLKGITLLVVVNKLFVFSSVLKQNMIFQFSQWPTESTQRFKFLQNSCGVKWFYETELQGLYL